MLGLMKWLLGMKILVAGLIFWCFVAPICVCALNSSLNDDILGLIVFKADIQDPENKLVSWNEEDDSPCNWNGVKCNSTSNRVSELVLDGFSLSGKLGRGLLGLQFLSTLSLANNNLTGSLTLSLGQLSNLRVLDLSENGFSGPIPVDFLQQCGSLRSISLANNKLTGVIPEVLSSCSAITYLNVSHNQLSGEFPSGILSLKGLQYIDLSDNMLEGEIPKGIEGLNSLISMNLRKNKFIGSVPDGIEGCLMLRSIDLGENSLSGPLPSTMQKLGFINDLYLQKNVFSGQLPDWIGEMRSLEKLDLSGNDFSGPLPDSLGNLQSLKILNISMNTFSGILPESMAKCENLLDLDVSHNSLYGEVPSWLFRSSLELLILSENGFNGTLDNPLASSLDTTSIQKLVIFDASRNVISGQIPLAIGRFSNLQYLSLSSNLLFGAIPSSIGQLKSLNMLDLSRNQLNGSIPSDIGGPSLSYLSLSMNNLNGPVPASLAKLGYLEYVDLSFNKLDGNLPKQLANLGRLVYFNVSHNELEGELPGGSFFNTISPSFVSDNPGLCGSAVNRTCSIVEPKPLVLNPDSSDSSPGSNPQKINHEKKNLTVSALIAIGAAVMIVVGVITVTVVNLRIVSSSSSHSPTAMASSGGDEFSQSSPSKGNSGKLVMFTGDLDFDTGPHTHSLLNKDCELGRGGFGTVYRTELKDGHIVAIKKLTVSSLVKGQDDFENEIKKLGKVHHPNLVTLEGYYWTSSLQLLIYEYISGGNLYKHLHEGSYGGKHLSWNERFSIIIGTAKSVAYLHITGVTHYNIKSSNVLIDKSGEPKVADYGLAKLLPMLDRYILSSKIQSALGYMAPEFACKTVKITEKCDVYAFGVLLLEIVTGKRPVEYMEDDVVVLCDLVRGVLEEGRVEECVDGRLNGKFPADEAIPVLKLGLICTSQVPSNRPSMAEVVSILELIRSPFESQDELV